MWPVSLATRRHPIPATLGLLSLALRSAVALEDNWTLSTQHLTLTFGERGVVSAVVDRATNRNLVLPAGGPQQSLISAVFATVPPASKAASSPTHVTYDTTSQTITATFTNGAVVPISVNVTADMIVLTLEAAGAHLTGLTDILFLTTPVQIQHCAEGPTAVFDDTFALLLLPGSLRTQVGTVYNEQWGSPMDPAGTRAHWDEPYASCNVSSTGVILRAHISLASGQLAGHSAALWGGPRAELDSAIQRGEAAFGLPSPTIGGVWSKRAPAARKGYFLISVTPDSLDATIDYATQSGMGYITLLVRGLCPCIAFVWLVANELTARWLSRTIFGGPRAEGQQWAGITTFPPSGADSQG